MEVEPPAKIPQAFSVVADTIDFNVDIAN